MKVVLPVHHFPPRYSAGAELYTLRLAQQLQARGHAVEVVAVERIDHGEPHTIVAEQDTYDGVAVQRLSFNLLAARERAELEYANPYLRDWFEGYLRVSQPDVVHCQAGYLLGVAPLEAAAALGIPTVLTLHDYWFLCPRFTLLRGDDTLCERIPQDPAGCAWCRCLDQRRYRWADQISGGLLGLGMQHVGLHQGRTDIAARRTALRAAISVVAAVIAPSQFLGSKFTSIVSAEQLRIEGYGLDLSRFARPDMQSRNDAIRIGYIGQIASHKGVHLLVDAVRRMGTTLRPAELHIHGGLEREPAYVAQLRRIAEGDARIVFHGRYDHAQLPGILGGLDVMVTPSTWYENRPLAILEAQAAGLPVVTAALGGMAELVRDGIDGLHFRAGDAVSLAAVLQRLLDEPELLPRLRAGVQPPRSLEDEIVQLLAIYEQVRAVPLAPVEAA